ncbi:hypothetical protein [Alicyclobacillus sp. ALC3]|uniref:hypothetical protein n=1 Tax=Alicyclobacillus sp. ALC3 TaxID=2796143 RepID=UPI0023792F6C|nr:hypothetical protein [Alicyclobacillus sp. ALC3]WDL96020.1 hypothetical protein JC200_16980 [Alicyclobacillus sp. ALC3]
MRNPLPILAGLALIAVVAGCGTIHPAVAVSQVGPASNATRSAHATKQVTPPAGKTTNPNPGGNTNSTLTGSTSTTSGATSIQYTSQQQSEIAQAAHSTGVKTPYIPQQIDAGDHFQSVEASGKFVFFTLHFKNIMVNESKIGGFAPSNTTSKQSVVLPDGTHATWYTFPSANGIEHTLVFTQGQTYMSIQPTDKRVAQQMAEEIASSLVGLAP